LNWKRVLIDFKTSASGQRSTGNESAPSSRTIRQLLIAMLNRLFSVGWRKSCPARKEILSVVDTIISRINHRNSRHVSYFVCNCCSRVLNAKKKKKTHKFEFKIYLYIYLSIQIDETKRNEIKQRQQQQKKTRLNIKRKFSLEISGPFYSTFSSDLQRDEIKFPAGHSFLLCN